MARETTITNNIKRTIRALDGAFINKYHGSPMTRAGHTDLYGTVRIDYVWAIVDGAKVRVKLSQPIGASFYLEVKQPGNTSTLKQEAFQRQVEKTAAVVAEVTSVDEAMEAIEPLLDLRETGNDN